MRNGSSAIDLRRSARLVARARWRVGAATALGLGWSLSALAQGAASMPIDPSDPLSRIAAPRAPGSAEFEELLLDVELNAQPQAEPVLVLRDRAGRLWVSAELFARWRLRAPAASERHQHLGQVFWPLDAVQGVAARIETAQMRLLVEAPAAAFQVTRLSLEPPPPPTPQRGGRGASLGYELFAQHTRPARGPSPSEERRDNEFAALAEATYFNEHGYGLLGLLSRSGEGLKRLETSWVRDMPESTASLRFGDALTRTPGSWGFARRFAGVQYATNFGTRPYMDVLPSLSLGAQATLPSTVEVFVNNAKVSSQSVDPGPFTIDRVPSFAGAGQVRVVVRDLFGREQVISRPFYASPALLRAGLDDFSFEGGVLRANYGLANDRYSQGFAAATWRRGLHDRLTLQGHVQTAANGPTVLAVGAAGLLGTLGAWQSDLALSGGKGSGSLLALGFERQSAGVWGYGVQGQWASSHFAHLGLEDGQRTPRRLLSGYGSWFGGPRGSGTLAWIQRKDGGQPALGLLSATYSVQVGREAMLLFTALRSVQGEPVRTFQLMYSTSLGERRSASAGVQSQGGPQGRTNLQLQAQQSVPAGAGTGWRAAIEGSQRQEAALAWQDERVGVEAEVARFEGAHALRASASGSLAWMEDRMHVGRRLGTSFGAVRLPEHPGVRIFVDNQRVARTDERGYAFIPRLRAFERNRIGIDVTDFGLDTQIDHLYIDVTPYARHGLVIDYPARRVVSALVRVLLADGQSAPTGAVLRIEGQDTEFPIALDGEAFVTGLKPSQRASLEWRGQRCEWTLSHVRSDNPLPRLGPFICEGVPR